MTISSHHFSTFSITDDEYKLACQLIYDYSGISLGVTKKQMVISRLTKRLRKHEMNKISDYLDMVQQLHATHPDRLDFINALTTNKTDFFREAHHFEYLTEQFISSKRQEGNRKIRIWSAGCSTGEEPYTLAMTLRESCVPAEQWDIRILASDIDSQVLDHASAGIYSEETARDIPADLLKKYFLRGSGANAGTVAAKTTLKELLTFRRINFIEDRWPINTKFDIIFCRNVVIYFDRPTQEKLFKRFAEHLAPGGLLILGHSENLHWMNQLYRPIGSTIYQCVNHSSTALPLALTGVATDRPIPKVVVTAPAKVLSTKIPVFNLVLGDVQALNKPGVLKTVLGSCISACLYDPETGIGGMNHFSLPGVRDVDVGARYGAHAMELLITAVMKKGADRSRLKAKVFGGGSLLRHDSQYFNVGQQNAHFVLKFLQDEGIPVVSQFLQPDHGIALRFEPHTGKAAVKPLQNSYQRDMLVDESNYTTDITAIVQTTPCGTVELF